MPVVLRDTSPSRVESALTLVNRVLRGRGIPKVESIEEDESAGYEPAEEVVEALWCLNEAQEILFVEAGIRYSHAEWYADLEPGVQNYEGPEAFQRMEADPFIDRELAMETPDSLLAFTQDFTKDGEPSRYFFWNDTIGLWPVPDKEFLLDRYAYYNSSWYVCIKRTDSNDSESAPDADTEHWAQTSVEPGDPGDFAWEAGKVYRPGRLRMFFQSGLALMASNDDTPVLPARFYFALVAGARWMLSQQLDDDAAVQDRLHAKFNDWIARLRLQAPYSDTCVVKDGDPL